jgi:hypothetical protein
MVNLVKVTFEIAFKPFSEFKSFRSGKFLPS